MSDTIEVVIVGKDEVSKTVGGIRQSLGGLGNAFAPLKTIGTAAFLGVGAAAVGGFGLAMGAAINMNASLEQSTMQFTTLMGDADLAAEHVANLFEFGAKTPFETEPIIAASKHFQIFGGAALNTMENLTLVGDAAAAVGAPIDEVGFWVGRLYSNLQAGQPFGEAAMRLQELGIMTPEVRARMEEMQATGQDGTAIWATYQEQLGSFTGAMEMQSQSWTGLMSTLKDGLAMAAANGLKPFFDMAKEGLGNLVTWLSSPAIQEGIAALAEKFGVIIQAVADFVSRIISGEDIVGGFANLFWTLAGAFGATEEQAKKVFEAVRTVGDKITEVAAALKPFVDKVVEFVQSHGPQLKELLLGIGIAFAAFQVISTIVGLITGFIGAISAAGAAISAAGGIVATIVAILGGPLTIVIAAISGLVALFAIAWKNDWGGIRAKTEEVINFLRPFIEGAITAIRTGIETFLTAVRTFWEQHGAAITATAEKAWNLIKGLIEGVIKHIKLIIDAFRLAFEGDWEGLGKKIFEIWENAWNTVLDFLRGLWDLVVVILVDFWDSIRTWFGLIDWGSLGRSIIQGIINGINSMGDALFGVLQGIVESAIARIKEALGIASPSRVFYEIGVAMADGLIQAIRDKQPDVAKVVDDMFSMLGNLDSLAGGFGDLFSAQSVAPLEGALAAVTDQFDLYTETIQGMMDTLGLGAFTPNEPGLIHALQGIVSDPLTSGVERDTANAAIALLREREQLSLEQLEIQRQLEEAQTRLLRLEMQRQQLGFLQQQFDLLKLIRDNGLDTSVLSGLQFGVDADPAALLEATIAAMTQMVGQTTEELLSIAPASRSSNRSLPDAFFADAAISAGRGGTVVVNIDARGAGQGVDVDLREMIREVMGEYGMRADIRVRTT